ncbi:hydrogenase accessory protein HypB [Halorhodospira abdelmalekii]|uniref:hydrogenase nickel incorporation protein HypB n=1 Tax=Halorhodospira abdelmalekii TaxID=421629 RepID=UPI0019089C24|nr:hydrogenase nickel incorporation protein HypB [Halorhodospira abdelmalekii]MBK1736001.1 hydrogenase accessory protein HypB [Halorhodospira abdelmalekii]
MCGICGCGVSSQNHESTRDRHHQHAHRHDHAHDHRPDHVHDEHGRHNQHSNPGDGAHSGDQTHDQATTQRRRLAVEESLFAENDRFAASNRTAFAQRSLFVVNLLSSPGSGKTTLLEATVNGLQRGGTTQFPLGVMEGDQQTDRDAERIRATGAPVVQINTGKACHLDAHAVGHALEHFPELRRGVLLIENVGNLVCPAGFDLGEAHKVVIVSVTEGEDKPLKYPDIFAAADLMIINKIDLLPYVRFDTARCIDYARRVHPGVRVLQLSAETGEGLEGWLSFLEAGVRRVRTKTTQTAAGASEARPPPPRDLPPPLALASSGPPVLATGAALKSTICCTVGAKAYVSEPIGDLDQAAACRALATTVERWQHRLAVTPKVIACDLHPDPYSTRLAEEWAARLAVPLVRVQHHHAHIGAIVAEHGLTEPVLGLALDGAGLGPDGASWGGELLWVAGAQWRRLGHLAPLPLPGGDRAAAQPWRMAAAVLHRLGRDEEIVQRFASEPAAAGVAELLAGGERDGAAAGAQGTSIQSTSLGRLFDAAAGLLGVHWQHQSEGQAAMRLEALTAAHGRVAPWSAGWQLRDGVLDFSPLLARLADSTNPVAKRGGERRRTATAAQPTPAGDSSSATQPSGATPGAGRSAERAAEATAAWGAALLHTTVAAGLAEWAAQAANDTGVNHLAAAGGCCANRVLMSELEQNLARHGITLYQAQRLPPNDSAISLGQAWIALCTQREQGQEQHFKSNI